MVVGKQAAIDAAGSQRELARLLGIHHTAITYWQKIPDKWILPIERVTGVDRAILRPDLYNRQEPT